MDVIFVLPLRSPTKGLIWARASLIGSLSLDRSFFIYACWLVLFMVFDMFLLDACANVLMVGEFANARQCKN